MIEPSNRRVVYDLIVEETIASNQHALVLEHLEEGLKLWLQYRDGIARASGLREVYSFNNLPSFCLLTWL